jgi:starvation-inducible DNA-binding protein
MLKISKKPEPEAEVETPKEDKAEDYVEEPAEEAEPADESPDEPADEAEPEEPAKETTHQEPSTVIDTLKEEVANAIMYWTNYKKYHWLLKSPQFYSLHKMFGKFADEVYSTIDDLAERVRMLDGEPPSSLEEFYQLTCIESAKATDEAGMIQEALSNIQHSIDCMRACTKMPDADAGTIDILSKFVQIYEKQRWFLKQHQKG